MNKESKDNKGRQFAVILEKIYSEIKLINEGQSILTDKLNATMGMVAKNSEAITLLDIRTSGIKDDITKMNGKLSHIEEIIRSLDKRLSAVETLK
jgi:hypothetical protein